VWILTAFAAITYACHFGGVAKAAKLDPWNIAASIALLPQNGPPLVNVTWTLTYEIFFYALFALIIVRPKLGILLLVAWEASVAMGATGLLRWNSWVAAYYFRPICLEFGIGILCALLVGNAIVRQRISSWLPAILLAVGVGLFGAGALYEGLVLSHGLESLRVVIFGGGAGFMILALALRESRAVIRVPSTLLWLGEASYAIYLVHYSVITFAAVMLLRLSFIPVTNVVLLGCVFLGVGAGGAFHLWLDRPIQRALRRLGRRVFDTAPRQPVYKAAPAMLHTGTAPMLAGHERSTSDRLTP
jgi:peptidoglycan/LPS O-acetylase OafA/YrhL